MGVERTKINAAVDLPPPHLRLFREGVPPLNRLGIICGLLAGDWWIGSLCFCSSPAGESVLFGPLGPQSRNQYRLPSCTNSWTSLLFLTLAIAAVALAPVRSVSIPAFLTALSESRVSAV